MHLEMKNDQIIFKQGKSVTQLSFIVVIQACQHTLIQHISISLFRIINNWTKIKSNWPNAETEANTWTYTSTLSIIYLSSLSYIQRNTNRNKLLISNLSQPSLNDFTQIANQFPPKFIASRNIFPLKISLHSSKKWAYSSLNKHMQKPTKSLPKFNT